ncbi:fasciclin domain-containing protein [Pontibacter sp. G13]|uniref:fasciclin domain-containing protein n=1 Tax=Pontibacter sp. G13 TaxID=3074898 RepID=UPI002889483C|nr:fasciclin domain-containing protein [Pontibacter sp. G13]WNJ18581.1 fasciclin domain-containing protein [Pontibacter sp. G13]
MKHQILTFWKFMAIGVVALTMASCGEAEPEFPLLQTQLEGDRFQKMEELLDLTDLKQYINGELQYTILAPTNEAFDAFLEQRGVTELSELPSDELEQIARYHILNGKADESAFVTNYFASSAVGYDETPLGVLIERTSNGVMFNRQSTIINANIEANDGFIHQMDSVITLPTVMDHLDANPELSIMAAGLRRANLQGLLDMEEPFTVFAIPDDTWNLYFDNSTDYESLDDIPDEEIEDFMRYHILDEFVDFEELQQIFPDQDFRTWDGANDLNIRSTANGVYLNNDAKIWVADLNATNGVIHFIDQVLTR